MVVRFIRNKVVQVEPLPGGELKVSWKLTDDLMEAEIELIVLPPELEIMEARARIIRSPHPECVNLTGMMENLEGVRIGSGLRKIVKGMFDGPRGCSLFSSGILECCNAVILHFTRPGIQAGERQGLTREEQITRSRASVKANPRLARSCIAFADDSPIMQGLNL